MVSYSSYQSRCVDHTHGNDPGYVHFLPKGRERAAGRGLGIVGGLVLLVVFRNTLYLGFVFECLALLVFFYVFFCNRLAYTFLNAGLYLARDHAHWPRRSFGRDAGRCAACFWLSWSALSWQTW